MYPGSVSAVTVNRKLSVLASFCCRSAWLSAVRFGDRVGTPMAFLNRMTTGTLLPN